MQPVLNPARAEPDAEQLSAAPSPSLYDRCDAALLDSIRRRLGKGESTLRLELETDALEQEGWSEAEALALAQQLRARLELAVAYEAWSAPSASRRAGVTVYWLSGTADAVKEALRHLPARVFGVPGLRMRAWRVDRRLQMVSARDAAPYGGHVDAASWLILRAPAPLELSKDARAETEFFGVETAARRAASKTAEGSQAFAATRFFWGGPLSLRTPFRPVLEDLEHHTAPALAGLSRAVMEGRTEPLCGVLASQLLGQAPPFGANAQLLHDLGAAPQGRSAAHHNDLPVLISRPAAPVPAPLLLHRRWPLATWQKLQAVKRAHGGRAKLAVVRDLGSTKGYAAEPAGGRESARL